MHARSVASPRRADSRLLRLPILGTARRCEQQRDEYRVSHVLPPECWLKMIAQGADAGQLPHHVRQTP